MDVTLNLQKKHRATFFFLRRLTLATFLCFIIALVGWPLAQSIFLKTASLPQLNKKPAMEDEIEQPHFFSRSKKGEPYEIWAEKSSTMSLNEIKLKAPKGKIRSTQGRQIFVSASQGTYEQKKAFLTLNGHVLVRDSLGHQLKTQNANVDLKHKKIEGNKAVHFDGPIGEGEGKAFSFQENEQILVLKGKAKLVIYPKNTSHIR